MFAQAKKDPTNPLYRRILRELNYAAETERAIPSKSQAEFDRYREKLKAAIAVR